MGYPAGVFCLAEAAMFSLDDSEISRGILESLGTGLCVLDLEKKIVLWSDGAERITGHLRHEVIGRCCIAEPLLHCDQPGCEFCGEHCGLARAMKTSHSSEGVGLLHHKAGHEIPVRARAVPVRNQHGSIMGAVETFEELQQVAQSDRRETIEDLSASFDPLTGATTRAMAESQLVRALAVFHESRVPFGILLLRVENLANFRASLGVEAAASFLRVVARTLQGALWMTDFIGRWSDDKFLVILKGCRNEALQGVRERVRRAIAGEAIEWWGERRSLPVSIGDASGQDEDTIHSLLERAHKSLEAASAWLTNSAAVRAEELPES